MDTCSHHYPISIFSRLNECFWNPVVSWYNAKNILGWKFDSFHVFKSTMIICWIFSALHYKEIFGFWQDFIFYGLLWNHVFNGTYSHLFLKNGSKNT